MRWGVGLLIWLFLLVFPAGAQERDEARTACIGAANTGPYLTFARHLNEGPDPVGLCIRVTQGSVENLEGLAQGRWEYAIAQNDVAHHMYRGINGFPRERRFRAVMPLFPEYVQVFVRANDATVELFGDLNGRNVNLGQPGSGSYINARDVMRAAGLREGVDYQAYTLGFEEALAALDAGTIDATIVTASRSVLDDPQRFRRVPVPGYVIDMLAAAEPYYEVAGLATGTGADPSLTVRAYLLARRDRPVAEVREIAGDLIELWPHLRGEFPDLPNLQDIRLRSPLPVHGGVAYALSDAGLAPHPPRYWLWMSIWALVLGLSVYMLRSSGSYNRLGARYRNKIDPTAREWALEMTARASSIVLVASLFAVLLLSTNILLRTIEARHAQQLNIDNPLADFTLFDSFFWMLTFVVSGFNEGDAYPMTAAGRLIVVFMALLFAVAPFAAIIGVMNAWGRHRAKALAGLTSSHFTDHVLVCGWNEKLPGLVYALTTKDAERPKHVTIVSQHGEASPLSEYAFDRTYVNFCRGDSADLDTLQRANAAKAEVALILADYQRRPIGNTGAILTAMNVRRLNPDIRVCAELAFDQNADHFTTFGCDTLITPDLFLAKVAALSTIDPLMIDFVLDALTYDHFDEIYAVPAEKLIRRGEAVSAGMTLGALEETLWTRGANLLGIAAAQRDRCGVYDAAITEDGPLVTLTRAEEFDRPLDRGDTVIFSAPERKAVFSGPRESVGPGEVPPIALEKFAFTRTRGLKILIYCEPKYTERLKANLKAFHQDVFIHVLDMDKAEFLTAGTLDCELPGDVAFDYILILASSKRKQTAADSEAVRAIDAHTVLFTRLLSAHAAAHGWKATVISEAVDVRDRQTFLDAGAHAIIPSNTLIERFMVKEAFDSNAVLDFLIAVMNMRDGTHFFAYTVTEDSALKGESYASLVRTRADGLHLAGWLPVSKRDELRNKAGDFDFHFRTAYDDRVEQTDIRTGDVIIFITNLDRLEQARKARAEV